jgi:pilus assembly protein CpaF
MSAVTTREMHAVEDQVERELISALRTTPGLNVADAADVWIKKLAPLSTPVLQKDLRNRVVANLGGFGVLDPLLHDPSVTELMVVNGKVWIERAGTVTPVAGIHIDEPQLLRIVERIIAPLGLQLNRAFPMVDARLPDGSRLNAIIPPLAIDGPAITIRRFAAQSIDLSRFTSNGGILDAVVEAVITNKNIVVSGSTGSGKTTLLNTLGSICAHTDRIVTIEDAAELRLPGDHIVRLEARAGGIEGVGKIGIRDLVRNALRMRPDRLIIGEVRGGEAFDMITALNTGHDGSMTTVHANSATDALRRLELMMLLAGIELPMSAVKEQIGSAIHVVIHVSRSVGGARQIDEVVQVRLRNGNLTTEVVAHA